jgi:energy-coupling factor transport system permease protein
LIERPPRSVLHRARASLVVCYLAVPCAAALVFDHPLALALLVAGLVLAGSLAGIVGAVTRALRLAVPLAIVVALVNPLVSREGLTVLARGPTLPVLGKLDVTLEALTWGGVAGLRVLVIVLAFAIYSAAVDPDEVLRALRRLSLRSALSASIATRLLPVLERDGKRLVEAYAFRADRARAGGARRSDRLRRGATVVRALVAGALDRAVDAAAALEVRGFGPGARRPRAFRRPPWSRSELSIAATTLVAAALVLAARPLGVLAFHAYPSLGAALGPGDVGFAIAVPLVLVLPLGRSPRQGTSAGLREAREAAGG